VLRLALRHGQLLQELLAARHQFRDGRHAAGLGLLRGSYFGFEFGQGGVGKVGCAAPTSATCRSPFGLEVFVELCAQAGQPMEGESKTTLS